MEGHVLTWFVLVSNHTVRAGDDAPGTTCAESRRDDLVVELFPLEAPPILFFVWCFRNGHVVRIHPIHRYGCVLGDILEFDF